MAEAPADQAPPRPAAGRRGLDLPHLWALVVVAGIFIILDLTLVRPHDFWWHVRVGQTIVNIGRVPTVDLFSYTQFGQPYPYQRWLMEVWLYLLLQAGGLPLVIFFHAATITTTYGVSLAVNRRWASGDLRSASAATLAGAALGLNSWNVRPQTISFLLFALTLYMVDQDAAHGASGVSGRGRHWALWALPPLFALWANLHGGFVYGLVLLGTYLAGELLSWLQRRQLFPVRVLLVTVLSAAATLLTPLGLDMIDAVLGLLHPVTQSLSAEFQPPTIRETGGLLFFGFALVLVVLLVGSGHRPGALETIRLLVFGVMGLMASRNAPWFGLVAAPTMAAALSRWAGKWQRQTERRAGRPALNLAFGLLVAALALLSLPWFRPHLPIPAWRRAYVSPETPVKATAFLRTLAPPRRVFHSEGYGSYLIWAAPEMPVFIDPRFELYPWEAWADFLALSLGRYDWQAILDRYEVDTLFLERETQAPLIAAAATSPVWELLYQDEQASILRRRSGP